MKKVYVVVRDRWSPYGIEEVEEVRVVEAQDAKEAAREVWNSEVELEPVEGVKVLGALVDEDEMRSVLVIELG